ncbi:hypothetical protein NB644_09570 [Oxalobacter formigenes]|uniref:hypothetical protein n=1 Tax=Oxalobacter formigenes TaxID=847 RepID=UPI0022B06882|nr:hypothetical protein [Oxalobacter formigenes]WAW01183.1 hypothetical protein NB644_09570 [Oxalobacter formigenes]WAW03511.1 hypothetical protein NB642_10340 [Oxalobacter formigenes]
MKKKDSVPFYAYYSSKDDIVDYASEEAKETMTALTVSYGFLRGGSEKLLNILLSGSAGSILLLLNDLRSSTWGSISTGLLVFFVLWAILAIVLLCRCMMARERKLGSSSPALLIYKDPDTDEEIEKGKIKRLRLAALENEINETSVMLGTMAKTLDRIRILAIVSPLIAILASAAYMAVL